MKSGIHKGPSKVQPFCICMEYIGCPTRFQNRYHILHCCKKELIKFLSLDRIILNGKPICTLERYSIRWISQNQVCFLSIHQFYYVLCYRCIPAHESVSANRPDISPFHKGCFLQCSGQIKIILLGPGSIPIFKKVSDLLFIKSRQRHIECLCLQSFNLHS